MKTWPVRGIAVAIGLLLALGTELAAQTPGPTTAATREGPWALLFQVKGNFVLAALQGSKVSIQHDVCGTDAIRLGASVSGSSSDATTGDRERDKRAVDFSAIYVHYPSRGEEVSLFLGIGPAAGFTNSSASQFSTVPTDSVANYWDSKSSGDSWYIGGQALLGAEWLLTRHIAITGEYSLSAWYSSDHSESTERHRIGDGPWETVFESDNDNDGWSFGDMDVKLGLIIYL